MEPKTHMEITKIAIEAYCDHHDSQLADTLGKRRYQSALVGGTKDEDKVSFSRATNWHFYPANSAIRDQKKSVLGFLKITIDPTSRSIVSQRQENMIRAIEGGASEFFFSQFGRVLHHIQDMSTPSHVLPIYHGPMAKDSYESYLVKYWDERYGHIKEVERLADTPEHVPEKLTDLYELAAQRLLVYLESGESDIRVSINNEATLKPSILFWKPYDPAAGSSNSKAPFNIQGFGQFAILGNRFGKTSLHTVNDITYQVCKPEYIRYASKLVCFAIRDTLTALDCVSNLIDKRFADNCFLRDTG